MMDRAILGDASSLYKLVTKNFASGGYNYFSTWSPKGDTILHFLLQTGPPLYTVIQAMQRSSRLKGQYFHFSVILTL